MLMDLFFETVPVRRKRRVHFNDFMADAHDRIQKHRQARKDGASKEDDPIPPVARALAEEAWVLCFDEFTVTDIADAMILSRLFSALFANGVVLVATSNVAPDDLYRDGLNRPLFLPFIGMLKRHAEVIALDSGTDYRMEKLNRMPVYLTPLSPETDRLMDEAWEAVTHGRRSRRSSCGQGPAGRRCRVAAGDAARFSFADLCEAPLGARDYLAIAGAIFDDLHRPHAGACRRQAQRGQALILLIDTLYDQHSGWSSAPRPRRRSFTPAARHRSLRVRPHRLAADRDAGPGVAGGLGERHGATAAAGAAEIATFGAVEMGRQLAISGSAGSLSPPIFEARSASA